MGKNLLPKYEAPAYERRLRKAINDVTLKYEDQYRFHHEGGLFVERVMRWVNKSGINYLRSALYLALTGCSCRGDGLSIPSKIRKEIEEEIVNQFETMKDIRI